MSETNRLQDKRNEHFRDWRNEDRDQREFVPFSHDQEQNQRIQKLEKQLREKLAQSENLSNDMKSLENAWSELVEKKQQLSEESKAAEAEHRNAKLALNAAKFKAKIKLLPPPPDSLLPWCPCRASVWLFGDFSPTVLTKRQIKSGLFARRKGAEEGVRSFCPAKRRRRGCSLFMPCRKNAKTNEKKNKQVRDDSYKRGGRQ